MPEREFFIFLIFFRNFLAWIDYEPNSGLKFFFSFSANHIPFWLKIMLERGFLIFWIFCYIFRNFLPRTEYERNLGLKFFSLFLGISHPGLYRNSVRIMFFSFLNFLAVFFGNGNPARVGTEFETKIFFSFLATVNPFG